MDQITTAPAGALDVPTPAAAGIPMPRIGAPLADGIFAGIARGEEGDHALVLLAAIPSPERLNWAGAMKWAEDLVASLPTRAEQSILFGNVRDQFPDGGWYWSCEQCAGTEASAWMLYFSNGTQGTGRKSYGCRARAVRRLPLLPFATFEGK